MFRVYMHDRLRQHEGAFRAYRTTQQYVGHMPGWVWILTLLFAMTLFIVPFLVLVFLVGLASMLVFFTLAIVARIIGLFASLGGGSSSAYPQSDDEGRRNVHVVDRGP